MNGIIMIEDLIKLKNGKGRSKTNGINSNKVT